MSNGEENRRDVAHCSFAHVVAEEITDPAEIAAIDAMRQRLKRKKSGPKAKGNGKATKAASKRAGK